jgi:hypothetical protein
MSTGQRGEERVAHRLEDGMIGKFKRGCQGKVRRIEERVVLRVLPYLRMRSASGDKDIESRRRVIIDVDREIEGVCDSTLASACQPWGGSEPIRKPITFVRKNNVRVAGSTGMRPETAKGRALPAITFAMLVCRRASFA